MGHCFAMTHGGDIPCGAAAGDRRQSVEPPGGGSRPRAGAFSIDVDASLLGSEPVS
jgi:hypothetical protein